MPTAAASFFSNFSFFLLHRLFLSSPSTLFIKTNPLQLLSFFSNFSFIHSNDLEKSLYWKEDKEEFTH